MTVDPSAETDAIFAPAGDLGEYLFAALGDPAELTGRLCAIESVSGNETVLADAVVAVLERISAGPGPDLEILRDGDTDHRSHRPGAGRAHRRRRPPRHRSRRRQPSASAHPHVRRRLPRGRGHLGTGRLRYEGRSGDAAVHGGRPDHTGRDVTWVFYDHEEVDASLNGLGRVSRNHPDWLAGDFAILGEPSNASVEGGCNGTIRVDVTTTGVRAHSARAFMGVNAIHAAAEVLTRLAEFETGTVTVDGLDYRESLSAVNIRGGVAGNVVPDECVCP
jgi:succinyl-diaminopimelate desuccinylase